MNTQPANLQKPTLVSVIAWMTLVSGIVNLFWGLAASGTALATIIGVFCTPLTILPTILGVFELIYAAKLFSNPAQPIQPSTNIAIFEIACVLAGNVFSMAVGILALVFYNDTVVKDYFARLNGTPVPVMPVVSSQREPTPPLRGQPGLAPVIMSPAELEEPAETPPVAEETPAPDTEETPTKSKRTPRKVAKK